MDSFIGHYVFDKFQGFEEYMEKIFGPAGAEAVKHFEHNKSHCEISFSDNKYTFFYTTNQRKISLIFQLDKECEETTFFGTNIKTVVYKDENDIFFVGKLSDGNSYIRKLVLTPEGYTLYFTDEKYGVTATASYKRV